MSLVYFVSLGPGDPELVTIKALKALNRADTVFYLATKSETGDSSSRAKQIMTSLNIESSKQVGIDVDMKSKRAEILLAYKQISDQTEELYSRGKVVAIACEGDVSFYASVHYILENLKDKDIETRFIPGVSSFSACGAMSQLHLVSFDERMLIVPGKISKGGLKHFCEQHESVVVMKLSRFKKDIKAFLEEMENVDFHYFENVTIEGKQFYTNNKQVILSRNIPYFSILIIKKI